MKKYFLVHLNINCKCVCNNCTQ